MIRLPRPPQRWLVRRGYEPYLTHVPLSYLALRADGYDVAHALYPTDALAAARWRRRTGRPGRAVVHGDPDPASGCRRSQGAAQVLSRAAEGCDAVVVLSDYAAAQYRQSLGGEVRVIHPGVDLRRFAPADARAEQPTIVCPAAVEEPRKNVALLLDAFSLVRERVPEARLVLSRPRDRGARSARAGIDAGAPGVQWRDLDDERSLARARTARRGSRCSPRSTRRSGWSWSRRLRAGRPSSGTPAGGSRRSSIATRSAGCSTASSPSALADAITRDARDRARPGDRARCREHAERFSTELCTERYLALYRELASAR